ncbi:restriction endonuclease subunit S [Limosilactobacillus reuteri]|uniref:restriction endonuclease subunit S n=1 Tax=Limosilactobacillus reuteri TaxID=1598 RepID=UPI003994E26D
MDKKPEKLVPEVRFKGFTDDWEQHKLEEMAEIVRGASPRPIKDKKWFDSNSTIGWIRISDVTAQNGRIYHLSQHISKLGQQKTRVVIQPHLLLSIAASVGYPVINYIPTGVHDGFLIFNNPKFNINYMFYWLRKYQTNWKKYGQPGSQVNLNSSIVSNTKVRLPSLDEQATISNIFYQIDKILSLQQRKLEQLKQLKKAMLQQLFVDKNNKQPNSRFKNFKGNWEQHRLEEVAQVTMGQSPSSKNYTDNPNDYVLVQGNADLKSNKISPRVWTKEITKQVHKGEIIMTVRAPVGYLAMANMDAVIGRGVAAIDGNKYLYYLLQTKLMDRTWEKLSSGSTFESISSNDIKNLEIKVTETEEEKLITKLMNTVTYFVTLQKNNLTQLTTLKKYLLQNLFI